MSKVHDQLRKDAPAPQAARPATAPATPSRDIPSVLVRDAAQRAAVAGSLQDVLQAIRSKEQRLRDGIRRLQEENARLREENEALKRANGERTG